MTVIENSALYEIVELESGEIVLCKNDERTKPLVSVKFSRESLRYLNDVKFEVAKAMIEAGLDAISEISDEEMDMESETDQIVLH